MARPRSDLFAEIEKMLVRDKRLSKTPPNSIAQIGVCNCGGQIELEINFKNPTVSETNFVGGVLNDGKVAPRTFSLIPAVVSAAVAASAITPKRSVPAKNPRPQQKRGLNTEAPLSLFLYFSISLFLYFFFSIHREMGAI
jgi:hypothetical protein